MGETILIFTMIASLLGIWFDFWAQDNPTLNADEKRKRKKKTKFITSVFIIIGFCLSYYNFNSEKTKSNQRLEAQLKSYKQIDTATQVGIEASKRLDSIKRKSESILSTLGLYDTALNHIIKNQNISKDFLTRADRIAYPLFPLTIHIYARLNLSELSLEKQKVHKDILNFFNGRAGNYVEGSIFRIANLGPNFKSYYIYNPHLVDSFNNPGANRLRQILFQFLSETDFSFNLGIYNKKPNRATSDSEVITFFYKRYSENKNFLDSYVFYDMATNSLLFYAECIVEESDVFIRKITGVVDLTDKFLRITSYLNKNRTISPFTEQVTFHCGKEKREVLDIHFKKSEIIPGSLPNAGSAFWPQSIVHKIEDKDFRFGYK